MHIVILGCGRVGVAPGAHRLDEMGHSVSVVDQDPDAFRKLGPVFSGQTVKGVGFDRETLESGRHRARPRLRGGQQRQQDSNILAARVARETYGVEQVVARIYDPRRAEVYQRLGIPTVATVSWTAEQIMRHILPMGAQSEYRRSQRLRFRPRGGAHTGQRLDRTRARARSRRHRGQGSPSSRAYGVAPFVLG
ncbi:MAG: NAD-binding protein [Candidatus Nanopelagicales bacterium]